MSLSILVRNYFKRDDTGSRFNNEEASRAVGNIKDRLRVGGYSRLAPYVTKTNGTIVQLDKPAIEAVERALSGIFGVKVYYSPPKKESYSGNMVGIIQMAREMGITTYDFRVVRGLPKAYATERALSNDSVKKSEEVRLLQKVEVEVCKGYRFPRGRPVLKALKKFIKRYVKNLDKTRIADGENIKGLYLNGESLPKRVLDKEIEELHQNGLISLEEIAKLAGVNVDTTRALEGRLGDYKVEVKNAGRTIEGYDNKENRAVNELIQLVRLPRVMESLKVAEEVKKFSEEAILTASSRRFER